MSEIDPADSVAGGTAEIPEEFAEDLETGAASSRLKKPVREGLPSGYKMRADAHYVDQLSSRRAERPFDSAQGRQLEPRGTDVAASEPSVDFRERRDARERPFDSAQGRPFDSAQDRPFDSAQDRPFDSAQEQTRRAVATQGRPVDSTQGRPVDSAQGRPVDSAQGKPFDSAQDRRADKAFAQLAEDVASIESAAAVLAGDVSPMTRRANVDVIVAQAWRASWLLRAMAILESSHRGHHARGRSGSSSPRFAIGSPPNRGWPASRLNVHASDWNAAVSVDEQAARDRCSRAPCSAPWASSDEPTASRSG